MNALRQYVDHFIVGQVEKGKQLGRTIGFPTANLNIANNVFLESGVYGVYVYYQSKKYLGMMNVGNRPSFNDGNHQTIEVHIIDFNEYIYDEILTVEIMFYIRKEKKFNQLQDLISQLKADKFYARKQFHLLK
ncbi:riboflavin kinase [Peribacillus asahii]|uniref:riboflavin kinase n=1 Tax=Peribacillus asahii TaxID=228899 RepID=A0A3T0KLX7_9BACI|nr:riboflavin kinase [Peribacillus asahii]AZV41308.1 RNA-binding riboflavin kinase [Peribacillus asahii]USK70807.1 riboflavin kinase [Peribacillus asahii]USK85667.1 riboflavin kinase [Peribacillus asahii]